MDDISLDNLLILKEKTRIYRDFFKISLEKIELQTTTHNTWQQDSKNVIKLLKSFALEDCNRLQLENYIFVLMDRVKLSSQTKFFNNNFKKSSTLTFESIVVCLDDYYRIQATQEYFAEENRQWIADLYSNNIAILLFLN